MAKDKLSESGAQQPQKQQKQARQDKPAKRSRVKETFAELKKVTWPTFGKTMKQTGAVLLVTVFFLVILLAMDQLLALAHKQLIKGLGDGGAEEAVRQAVRGVKNAVCSLFNGGAALPIRI